MQTSRTLLLLLSPLLALVAAQSKDVCYGITGNQEPNLGVCDPDATVSACCPFGEICYSNGLCSRPGVTSTNATVYTIYGVHGCTRNGGSTGACFAVDKCLSKGVGVTVCDTNRYCCYGLRSCNCSDPTQVFSLPAGTILTTLAFPTSTTISSSRTSSATTSPTTGSAASITGTASQSSSPTAAGSSSGGGTSSVAVGAGVGVGVGVALIILAGLAFFFWRRRHRRQKALLGSQPGMASPQQSYAGDAKYGASAVYSPVAQHNPDGPDSYNQFRTQQEPSELDGSRSPVQMPANELQGSRVPDPSSEVKPAQYR